MGSIASACARQIIFGVNVGRGARARCQLAGRIVDLRRHNPVWYGKLSHIAISPMLMRAPHKFRPNRHRRRRAVHFEVFIIVQPYPNNAQQLRSESAKPGVL